MRVTILYSSPSTSIIKAVGHPTILTLLHSHSPLLLHSTYKLSLSGLTLLDLPHHLTDILLQATSPLLIAPAQSSHQHHH